MANARRVLIHFVSSAESLDEYDLYEAATKADVMAALGPGWTAHTIADYASMPAALAAQHGVTVVHANGGVIEKRVHAASLVVLVPFEVVPRRGGTLVAHLSQNQHRTCKAVAGGIWFRARPVGVYLAESGEIRAVTNLRELNTYDFLRHFAEVDILPQVLFRRPPEDAE